ncbi:sacsin N-terminal ATP-binding-like domain-containing protein [Pseudonocardia acidicola]|uniref:ATP-binding protein n=1 Tax=Pseudonocardia acidicola TaxID=2724939 RepID=A0ABX1SCF7_9PSEU|nr:ATP-binding protein [Pseudonocardia acidicola]NMH98041.1 ATP-binding protein [Pseudonocardia acidicola]
MPAPEIADPYRTAALRAAVLDAWAGSPTRFREDANAEEDLLLGGYADAWFVELAQNAADAARAASVPGRLQVTVVDGELRVANTGTPLDAAGVAALASLRASAKRDEDGSVGRFGVGFAAVLAVSAEPRVVSGAGSGVRFSAAGTAAEARALPGPAEELDRRGGQLPVLRLVWPVAPGEAPPPTGFDTEVRLPLRADADPAALLAAALDAAPDLLLALPGLVEIAVGDTVLRRIDDRPGAARIEGAPDGPQRWLLARRTGRLDAAAAGAQATELRGRLDWTVCWAVPVDTAGRPRPLRAGAGEVLHAPTASAERLSLPARLIATIPLEPDRRRTRSGPVTDRVLAEAGPAYLDLVRGVPPADRMGLVPEPGFPRSELDARLREVLFDALRGAAWLPGAGDPAGTELAPGRAEWLDLPGADGLAELLAGGDPAFAGLLAPDTVTGAHTGVLAELGVHRLGADELVARLLGVRRPARWWQAVYTALEPAAESVPGLVDELRGLPVPLADGRTVAGPSSVLLPGAEAAGPVARLAELGLPGLHIAAADAVHPLLARLGAAAADPVGVLDQPALRDAVERSVDDAEAGLDTRPLAEAVLDLVGELGPGAAARRPWLGALALPDTDGEPARADELMLPDAALRPLLAGDVPVGVLDAAWADRVPRSVLTAAGVLDGFAVVVDDEPAGPDHDLHDEDLWWDGLDEPPAGLVAVRDLDLVADDAWPAALRLLAGEPDTRAAVLHGGYTAWWLAAHARLGGHRPGRWRLPSASGLAALYDPAPVGGDGAGGPDEAFLAAIGVRAGFGVTDDADAADLLDRLSDPERHPDVALVAAAHAELAAAVACGRVDPAELDAPEQVRALDGSVVGVDDAVVLDAPWLAAVLPAAELVAGGDAGDSGALADLLDLPLASDVVSGSVVGTGRTVRWADLAEVVVACHTLGLQVPSGELIVHDELVIELRRPAAGRRPVPAWHDADGRWHASDPVRALLATAALGRSDEPVAG